MSIVALASDTLCRLRSSTLRLTIDDALLDGALDLLRIGQRRPEGRAIVWIANALQPRKVATVVMLEAGVMFLQKLDEDA